MWKIFASHYYLFRGTPTRMWLDYAFQELFGLQERLSEKTADRYFDTISEKLLTPDFLPRALYERFNLEVLSTTDSPLATLDDHKAIREFRLERQDSPHLPPRSRCRSRVRRICRIDREAGRDHRRRHGRMERLSERPAQDASALSRTRMHRDRPRASHCANGGSLFQLKRPALSRRCSAAQRVRSSRSCSGRRCSLKWPG